MNEKGKKVLLVTVEIFLLLIISPFIYRYVCNFCLLLLRLFKVEYGPYKWFVVASFILSVCWVCLVAKASFLKNWYLKIILLYLILFPSLCMLFIIWYFTFVPIG
jgi:hypothetical protein